MELDWGRATHRQQAFLGECSLRRFLWEKHVTGTAEADSRLPVTRAASANQNVTNDTLREKPEEKCAVFADDSQLHRSSQPPDTDPTVLGYQGCLSDIRGLNYESGLKR